MREIRGASHGYSCQGWARHGREFKQNLGVRRATGSFFKAGAVADGLAQIGELALQPPSQRTEPEHGGIEAGQHLQIKVTLPDVRALMRHDRIQLGAGPLAPIDREHDGRARDSQRHRRRNAVRFANLDSGG